MNDLTDEQKEQARKVMNALVDHIWSKVAARMVAYSESYDEAWEIIRLEILNEAK